MDEGLDVELDSQMCSGELIRFRNLNGYCNDIFNPLMGSTDQPFARNVQFEAVTFLDLKDEKKSQETKNRHGNRLQLLSYRIPSLSAGSCFPAMITIHEYQDQKSVTAMKDVVCLNSLYSIFPAGQLRV